MASRTLYPPIVNSFEPAFVAGSGSQLRVYFSLSSLSSVSNISNISVHASIMRKDGVKVLNTKNDPDNGRYRATGIILNMIPRRDTTMENNLYYIVINNNDLDSQVTLSGTTYNGWIPGWTYKIQLRLSTAVYPGGDIKQAVWLQEHANDFSEWSTICYTKVISEMALQIPLFEYNSQDKAQTHSSSSVHYVSGVDISGSLGSSIPEANEDYNYVNIKLYKNNQLLEDSGDIFKTELSNTYFHYELKTKIQEEEPYRLSFTYETENGYIPKPLVFTFVLTSYVMDRINAHLVTIDNDTEGVFDENYSLIDEEDAGRIGLKIVTPDDVPYFGNICVRRASAEDNFATWEDIKIIVLKNQHINDYPIIYDYTIQSGVWYKYGVQSISEVGERGILVEMDNPIQRIFNYSFLLGQDDKQLRLQFDNIISSYKHQIYDSKIDPIGSKYPFINRNGVVNYRVFPLSGLITMWMDEDNLFLHKGEKEFYHYTSVVNRYQDYRTERGISQYDYTQEREFRQKVLEFLQDGKPKLFKSPTEGNIIVRLMDVGCTPNQSVDRLIYNFSATANEIDDSTMKNYLKYGFYNPGAYGVDFGVTYNYIGQLSGKFKVTDNLFKLIYEKYDSQGKNLGGYSYKLEEISRIKITIDDPPMRIKNNNGDLVVGNNFRLVNHGKSSIITIYDPRGIYEFDSLLSFYYYGGTATTNDGLYLLGDADNKVTEVNATIDFIYSISIQPYKPKDIKERKPVNGIGQFFEEVKPGTSIFNSIYYKYYIESDSKFRYLSNISSIEIEANPFTVFAIKDSADSAIQYHEINETGILRLHDINNIVYLNYVGKRYPTEFNNESTLSQDIIKTDTIIKDTYGNDITIKAAADVSVTYRYTLAEGYYKE